MNAGRAVGSHELARHVHWLVWWVEQPLAWVLEPPVVAYWCRSWVSAPAVSAQAASAQAALELRSLLELACAVQGRSQAGASSDAAHAAGLCAA